MDQFVILNPEPYAPLIKLMVLTFFRVLTALQLTMQTVLQIKEIFVQKLHKMVLVCSDSIQINASLKTTKPVLIIIEVSALPLMVQTAHNKHIPYNKDHTVGQMMDHNALQAVFLILVNQMVQAQQIMDLSASLLTIKLAYMIMDTIAIIFTI